MARISDIASADWSAQGLVNGAVVTLTDGEAYGDFALVPYDVDGLPGDVIPISDPRHRVGFDRMTGLADVEIDLSQHAGFSGSTAGRSLPAAIALVTTHGSRVLEFRAGASDRDAPAALFGPAAGMRAEPVPPMPDLAADPAQGSGLLCFAAGTPIDTPNGPRAVDQLAEGDLITTVDNGAQAVRWIYRRTVRALGQDAPVVLSAGAIGNHAPVMLSRRHAVVVPHDDASFLFGSDEVMAEAGDLIDGRTVFVRPGGMMTYYHLMLDGHELLRANGALVESFRFSADAERDLGRHAVAELRAKGFDLATLHARFATPVRPMIPRAGARLLARAA